MSVAQLLSKAQSVGVRLILSGDGVKLRGPADSIAALRSELASHKPEIVAHLRAAANDPASIPADCIGALQSADGGLCLPGGPCLSPDDVKRMQGELVAMIEQLADMEHWPQSDLDDVLTRAVRGPLSDLLPNLTHFTARLSEARAETAARELADSRVWRANDDLTKRGYTA